MAGGLREPQRGSLIPPIEGQSGVGHQLVGSEPRRLLPCKDRGDNISGEKSHLLDQVGEHETDVVGRFQTLRVTLAMQADAQGIVQREKRVVTPDQKVASSAASRASNQAKSRFHCAQSGWRSTSGARAARPAQSASRAPSLSPPCVSAVAILP